MVTDVLIIPTGVANMASVMAGLRRAGVTPRESQDRDEIEAAAAVVLPGVGAFDTAMDWLVESGLDEALRARVAADRPLLAICLGLQLLAEGSEEAPGRRGLGVLPGVARRFPSNVRIPQLGWNVVTPGDGFDAAPRGAAYFANSFRLVEAPGAGWSVARADYGGAFIAAVQRGSLLACQFHPELSGVWGQRLLEGWCRRVRTGTTEEVTAC